MTAGVFRHNRQRVEILVFVDLPESELDDYGKGILSEASRLAETLSVEWSVLCFAGVSDEILAAMVSYGVERLILIDAPEDTADSLEIQGKLIALAAQAKDVSLLLLPHNDLGGSLAPLLAAELDSALYVEAISYNLEENCLKLDRQILGAQVSESKSWDGSRALVLTMNTRVLSSVVLPSMQPGEVHVECWKPQSLLSTGTTLVIERIPADPQTVDVSEAQVMISAGLGCNQQSFALVEELARLLNASLGVTRPVYDLGYTGFERMVGQTGKTVAPRFYLALGISGSMHHLGGIKDSKRIVSVNNDPLAPIIPNSDESFVADLREVLPLLIERLKKTTVGGA